MNMGCDIGIMGLGIMGRGFSLNAARNGYKVSVWTLSESCTDSMFKTSEFASNITIHLDIGEFVQSLSLPRKILILIPVRYYSFSPVKLWMTYYLC